METNKEIVFNIPEGYEVNKEKSNDSQIVYRYKQIDVNQEVRDFLFNTFDGLTIDLKYDKNYITYKKDNYIYLIYNLKTKCLYYNYYKIYLVLKEKYSLKEQEINDLVKGIVYETLKLDAETTTELEDNNIGAVYETLKLDAETTYKSSVKRKH